MHFDVLFVNLFLDWIAEGSTFVGVVPGLGPHFDGCVDFGGLEVVVGAGVLGLVRVGPGGLGRPQTVLLHVLDGMLGILPQKLENILVFLPILLQFTVVDGGLLPLQSLVHGCLKQKLLRFCS